MATMGPNRLWEEGEKKEWVYRAPAPSGSKDGEGRGPGLVLPKERPYWRGAGRLGLPARPVTGSTVAPAVSVKRRPCLEEFQCLRCTLSAPHTHSVEHLARSPEELAGDPNKSLKLLGKRKENPETPAGINRDRRGQRPAEPSLAGQVPA